MRFGFNRPAVSCAILLAVLAAGPAAGPLRAAEAEENALEITRADLAASYLRFETFYLQAAPAGAEVARLNQGFDEATMAFFQNKYSESIKGINELTESLLPGEVPPSLSVAGSLGVRVDPPVLVPSRDKAAMITTFEIYPPAARLGGREKLAIRVVAPDGATIGRLPFAGFERDAQGAAVPKTWRLGVGGEIPHDAAPGVYQITIATTQGLNLAAARLTVAPRPMDEVREEYLTWLGELEPKGEAAAEAKLICTERLGLLTDSPSPKNSAQFMADMNALEAEIHSEITEIAADGDPYKGRTGDYWRYLPTGRRGVPFRLYVPAAAGASEKKIPLVIALHGAGGDENMFMEAYGGGMIRDLADRHGFIAASPATNVFAAKAENFDMLLTSLEGDYPIDRERVYVIGHSMGAGATAGIVARQGRKVRAACCLAGGRAFPGDADIPPTLVVAAELDPIVPASRIEPFAKEAIAAGLPVEYKLLENYGHTIMVTHYLPGAVEWLMKR